MAIQDIVAELEDQLDRINRAIDALRGNARRKAGTKMNDRRRGPRNEAARKRMSEAMTKHWVERRRRS